MLLDRRSFVSNIDQTSQKKATKSAFSIESLIMSASTSPNQKEVSKNKRAPQNEYNHLPKTSKLDPLTDDPLKSTNNFTTSYNAGFQRRLFSQELQKFSSIYAANMCNQNSITSTKSETQLPSSPPKTTVTSPVSSVTGDRSELQIKVEVSANDVVRNESLNSSPTRSLSASSSDQQSALKSMYMYHTSQPTAMTSQSSHPSSSCNQSVASLPSGNQLLSAQAFLQAAVSLQAAQQRFPSTFRHVVPPSPLPTPANLTFGLPGVSNIAHQSVAFNGGLMQSSPFFPHGMRPSLGHLAGG